MCGHFVTGVSLTYTSVQRLCCHLGAKISDVYDCILPV